MAFASSVIGAQEAIIQPCDLCEDHENVDWFCKDCNQNLCERCKRSHLRSKVSKDHIVLSISEGFAMGKMNISNICKDHDELFTFFCRTCDRNICSKCLSTEHKKHDFVDLRELKLEVEKQLNDVIVEKENEKQMMKENYDNLVQHVKQSEIYSKEQCANIDEKVRTIKETADEEAAKLKESIRLFKHCKENEAEEGKSKIQAKTRLYDNEIRTIKQELHLQTASSLHNFVRNSMAKLKSLQPMVVAIPKTRQHFSKKSFDKNKIREMMKEILRTQKLSKTARSKRNEVPNSKVLSNLEIVRKLNLNKTGDYKCMCLSADGNIWIGCKGYVYKLSSDCSTVIHHIPTRSSMICQYIACLQKGDAVASYGGVPFIDRFTSDGNRLEFKDIQRIAHHIDVNNLDEVLINVAGKCIRIFSNAGKQLREFPVDEGIKALCTDKDGYIIVLHERLPKLAILDGGSGEVKKSWAVSMSNIQRLSCDNYGNILAMNILENIYYFSKNGEVTKTFTVNCDQMKGICVSQDDHLLILVQVADENIMLVTHYLE